MSRYRHYYEIEVRHPGLHKYRHIRGSDPYVVQQKAAALEAQWNDEWARRASLLDRQQSRLAALADREAMKEEAAELTNKAQDDLLALSNILQHTLAIDDRVSWDGLKDRAPFPDRQPTLVGPGHPPVMAAPPERPDLLAADFQPKLDLLSKLVPSRRAAAVEAAKVRFNVALASWEGEMASQRAAHQASVEKFEQRVESAKRAHERELAAWEARRQEYLALQAERNAQIDARAASVQIGEESAVSDFIDIVLSKSQYPEFMNVDYVIDYDAAVKSVVIDFELPSPDQIPTLKEVKYVQARNEFDRKYISEAERGRLYDGLIYQVCLRTIHEIVEADVHGNIERVTFNGWVSYVDRATGADQRSCIASIGVNRGDFEKVDLARVDPRECFKALKGVAASKLVGLAPVAPLERPRAADRRFVESQDVVTGMDDTTNLAAMHWEDFEHLVRQVFEAEFASANGEVRVTQASRDGGVDAVIFDPDPIRGGKIIVQAKRYTNVVDVSAVRDLYGTVQHEGASKGILVTTSQYGPDARKFAQDKPITLIDGGNLLYLLEKMGVKARINLAEAKALQKQMQ
jgi:restriction system protein